MVSKNQQQQQGEEYELFTFTIIIVINASCFASTICGGRLFVVVFIVILRDQKMFFASIIGDWSAPLDPRFAAVALSSSPRHRPVRSCLPII